MGHGLPYGFEMALGHGAVSPFRYAASGDFGVEGVAGLGVMGVVETEVLFYAADFGVVGVDEVFELDGEVCGGVWVEAVI